MVDRDTNIKDSKEIGLVELRRGVLVLAVLSRLRQRQYGYSLRQALAEVDVLVALAAEEADPQGVELDRRDAAADARSVEFVQAECVARLQRHDEPAGRLAPR